MPIRRSVLAALAGAAVAHRAWARSGARQAPALLHADEFRNGLKTWFVERARGGRIEADDGVLEIEVPAGATAWFRPQLAGRIAIAFDAQAVAAGGPHDRVSDLNCFWMATDPRSPRDFFARPRSGVFEDYDALRCYYVGLGGNSNSTTRFRRYVGETGNRPLRPQDDLRAPQDLLVPNAWQRVVAIAHGEVIQYWRDGRRLFDYRDPEPYTRGWFGLRTTQSHLRFRRFRVWRLPADAELSELVPTF